MKNLMGYVVGALLVMVLAVQVHSIVWHRAENANIIQTGAFNIRDAGEFYYGSTSVTSTANEFNYLDITTLGQSENSKAFVMDANGKFDVASADTLNIDGVFSISNTTVSSAADELNYVDITTLGTSQDSKAATYSATGKHTVAAGDTVDVNGILIASDALILDWSEQFTVATNADTLVMSGVTSTDVVQFTPLDTAFTGYYAWCGTDTVFTTVADAGTGTKKANITVTRPE